MVCISLPCFVGMGWNSISNSNSDSDSDSKSDSDSENEKENVNEDEDDGIMEWICQRVASVSTESECEYWITWLNTENLTKVVGMNLNLYVNLNWI